MTYRSRQRGSFRALVPVWRSLRVIYRDLRLNVILASPLLPPRLRAAGLRSSGLHIGTRARIRPRCFFGGNRIYIGNDSIVSYGCFFDNAASITVGDRTGLGMEVMLCTGTHEIGDARQRFGQLHAQPIVIGHGCWLGARSMVLPGVTIGDGCIISAGAVVNADCQPNGLYAGVPARRVRDLPVGADASRPSEASQPSDHVDQ